MSAKKRGDDQDEVSVNPFLPDLSQISADFKFTDLMETYKTRLQESDKKKVSYAERARKNEQAIERIRALIAQLQLKMAQENSSVWVAQIVRPLAEQVQKAFKEAVVEVTQMSGSAMITLSKKNVSPTDKLKGVDAHSIVVVPHDSGLAVRDFSKSSNEYGPGTPGAMAFLNHPLVPLSPEKVLDQLIEWLLR
jgi:hypothetical protein